MSQSIQKQIQDALRTNKFDQNLIDNVNKYKVMNEENRKTLANKLSDGLGAILNNPPSTATDEQEAQTETNA